jgi:hypothetical protein
LTRASESGEYIWRARNTFGGIFISMREIYKGNTLEEIYITTVDKVHEVLLINLALFTSTFFLPPAASVSLSSLLPQRRRRRRRLLRCRNCRPEKLVSVGNYGGHTASAVAAGAARVPLGNPEASLTGPKQPPTSDKGERRQRKKGEGKEREKNSQARRMSVNHAEPASSPT